jgi:predicted nucleic acid-binding protein
VGELLAGFRLGSRYRQNARELAEFLADPAVSSVGTDNTTADRYARLVVQLRRRGRPIPTNDIWIAAQALQTGADLISFDAHFGEVDGVAWIDPS